MSAPTTALVVVVMGVSGCGKSTLGRHLSSALAVPFTDADDLHPPANVAKMRSGTPLNDDDRAPWLAACASWLADASRCGGGVLACSALKRRYREALIVGSCAPRFVFLDGDISLLRSRVAARALLGSHYMPPALLDSQLATLEAPAPEERAIRADLALTVDAAVALVLHALSATVALVSAPSTATAATTL